MIDQNRKYIFPRNGEEAMKKIEMIIRPEKLEDVKEILNERNLFGMTVTMASGCGHQKGRRETYRGTEFNINLLPKVKVEVVVHDGDAAGLIEEVTKRIQTGQVGDGKIFVYNVEQAVRLRTGESGDNAI
jgi:nitrogen regulatory protein P-II 1